MVTTDGTPLGNLALNVFAGQENGPPMIFVHGVLRCWQDFRPLFPYFGYDWQCLAIDQRGHGQSEHAEGHYRVVDYVGDIAQFVDNQFDEPVILYGHSLGGMVVAGVAAELGEKVSGIVMEDPPFETMGKRLKQTPLYSYFHGIRDVVVKYSEPEEIAPAFANLIITDPQTGATQRAGDTRDEAAILFAAKCLAKIDPQVLDPIVDGTWLEGYDFLSVTSNIDCPALLLQGDPAFGGMLLDADVQAMKGLKPNLFHVMINGGSHQLHWTKSQEVFSAVTAFLLTP